MNNNTILALVFLMAGTLLTTTAVTMVPAAYADDNKNRAEDESQIAQNDCDDNDDVDCIAVNLGELDIEGRLGPIVVPVLRGIIS